MITGRESRTVSFGRACCPCGVATGIVSTPPMPVRDSFAIATPYTPARSTGGFWQCLVVGEGRKVSVAVAAGNQPILVLVLLLLKIGLLHAAGVRTAHAG